MSKSSKLLIDEYPLQVLPTLACLLGLGEGIVIQQIHYWLHTAEKTKRLGVYKNGRWWIFNNLATWQRDNFPFWSTKTVQRLLDSLREKKVVIASRLSTNNLDQTLYYTIDYDHLNLLIQGQDAVPPNPPIWTDCPNGAPFGHNDQMDMDKLTKSIRSNCPTVNSLTEITSETTQRVNPAAPHLRLWEMIDQQLRADLGKGDYNQWIHPLKPSAYQDGVLTILAVNSYCRDWCQSRIGLKVSRLATAIAGQETRVEFELETNA